MFCFSRTKTYQHMHNLGKRIFPVLHLTRKTGCWWRIALTHFRPMLFLYPLKTTENQRFPDCFEGVQKENIDLKWIKKLKTFESSYKRVKSLTAFTLSN